MFKRLALVALATSSPLIAQNQEAPADTEWLWYERAIVEGILAGAFVGSLVGVSQCSEESYFAPPPAPAAGFCVAPPVPKCEGAGEHAETIAKAAGIGALIGLPAMVLVRAIGQAVTEESDAELRVGPAWYRSGGVAVGLRVPAWQ